jgi:ferredoxin-NADP reductase
MRQFIVAVKSVCNVTHNVIKIITNKPPYYHFWPGEATDVAINKPGWTTKTSPFTFTSIPANNYLEFTIKIYPQHKRITNELLDLKKGDELILHDVYGTFNHIGEGVFIAGGAGVTPFMSIIRQLHAVNQLGENKLIFANKTKGDIIYESELKKILGKNFINILSDERLDGYDFGHIDVDYIEANSDGLKQYFYLCGPPPMVDAIEIQLQSLQVDTNSIIKEVF